jgi:hypothetical protein
LLIAVQRDLKLVVEKLLEQQDVIADSKDRSFTAKMGNDSICKDAVGMGGSCCRLEG